MAEASTTSRTGASSSRATSAVDDGGPVAGAVEEAHDAFDDQQVAPRARPGRPAGAMASAPQSQASRLRGGRPEARAW